MQKTWYCIVYYYPWGLPKVKYLTLLPNVKEWAEKSKRKRKPTKTICSFLLIDQDGNLLEYGENLTTVFRPFRSKGYKEPRLILSREPREGVTYEKIITAVRLGKTIILSDGKKEITTTTNEWENALLTLLISLSKTKK